MFRFIRDLIVAILNIAISRRKDLIFTLLMLRKQNEILKRQIDSLKERLQISSADRWSLAMIAAVSKPTISLLHIFKPEAVLAWRRKLIAQRWTYTKRKPGRKPVKLEIKNLILNMKNDNSLWGCRRITDELGKLGIDIHQSTGNQIIQDFRKNGRITVSGSWSRFLKAHWDTIYGMDFMTIDTIFSKRLYLLIVLTLKTRQIKYWDMAEYPTTEFVRQRIIDLQDKNPDAKYLIRDNAPQFTMIDYQNYGINGVNTSVAAPNMNAFTERVIGTIRREDLDHFLLFSERQTRKIVSEYIEYYNRLRPHPGIECIPAGKESTGFGEIVKTSILSGLHHN